MSFFFVPSTLNGATVVPAAAMEFKFGGGGTTGGRSLEVSSPPKASGSRPSNYSHRYILLSPTLENVFVTR